MESIDFLNEEVTSKVTTDTPKHSTQSQTSKREGPSVLIVGAGVAGLFLAILLERVGIYQVYERAKEVKSLSATLTPQGAIMSLNVGAIPALEQMGLCEDLWKVSLDSGGRFKIYDSDLSLLYSLNTSIEYV
ncbi:hypothetical protein BGX24_007479 [Mortierella sp. AD032]|nr:hypothetical protein BGX24_007479 [Mortierella sp. AD032]